MVIRTFEGAVAELVILVVCDVRTGRGARRQWRARWASNNTRLKLADRGLGHYSLVVTLYIGIYTCIAQYQGIWHQQIER